LVAANVLYHLRKRTETQPYLLAGIGRMSVDYSYTHGAGTVPGTGQAVPVYEQSINDSKSGFTFGVGVKALAHGRVSIRMELFNLVTGANETRGSSWWDWVRLSAGLGLHF
jgi:opacity protein-like surface antigen